MRKQLHERAWQTAELELAGLVGEMLRIVRGTTTVVVRRRLQLGEVARAVERAVPRPSWRAVFLKAFAHLSALRPELRRCFVPWPIPRLYEHRVVIAAVPVERSDGFLRLTAPESRALHEIDALLTGEGTSSPPGRSGLRLAWSGRCHAEHFGTFALGAGGPASVPALHVGPVGAGGVVDVCLRCDERVLGRGDTAGALEALEDVLHDRILVELRYAESVEAA